MARQNWSWHAPPLCFSWNLIPFFCYFCSVLRQWSLINLWARPGQSSNSLTRKPTSLNSKIGTYFVCCTCRMRFGMFWTVIIKFELDKGSSVWRSYVFYNIWIAYHPAKTSIPELACQQSWFYLAGRVWSERRVRIVWFSSLRWHVPGAQLGV